MTLSQNIKSDTMRGAAARFALSIVISLSLMLVAYQNLYTFGLPNHLSEPLYVIAYLAVPALVLPKKSWLAFIALYALSLPAAFWSYHWAVALIAG